MSEKKMKHLDMIQSIISRLAGNSFLLKGWSVTLVSALFALAATGANARYALISFFPVPFFWALDGYFLSKERQFRDLYNLVRVKDDSVIDFSMDVKGLAIGRATWLCSVFSETILPFHGVMVVVILLVRFAIA